MYSILKKIFLKYVLMSPKNSSPEPKKKKTQTCIFFSLPNYLFAVPKNTVVIYHFTILCLLFFSLSRSFVRK